MDNSKVSQNYLFNLLAGAEYEYPLLQKEAVEALSKNITDIVYTTLKQKSTASSVKRCNLLHLINITCQTPEFHKTENISQVYLKHYEREFCNSVSPTTDALINSINKEQCALSSLDVHSEVVEFYKRKRAQRKEVVKRLEFMKQMDLEDLQKVNMPTTNTVSAYETDQNLIHQLLKDVHTPAALSQADSLDVRKKQVGLLYAIVNIGGESSSNRIVNYIMDKLLVYETLQQYEVKMLEELWLSEEYSELIVKKFPFVMEKIIVRICKEIVKLSNSLEVSNYFLSLTNDVAIQRLRKVCAENFDLYCSLKSLIFELYVYSYCNENVYKFSNYII